MTDSSSAPVALVTGGSRGIGAAIVSRLTDEGWYVISVSRGIPDAREMTNGVIHVSADLSTEEGMRYTCAAIFAKTEKLDLLVNNVGGMGDNEEIAKISYNDFARSTRLNLMTPLFLAQALTPLLRRGNTPSVINLGSIYGQIADPDVAGYCLTKSAIPLLTRMLARTLAPEIRVNCVSPGHVDTDMTRGSPKAFLDEVRSRTPLARIGDASEVADLVLFLASPRASFINGADISVDGGFMTTR